MHPEAMTRLQIEMRSYRFLWVNMMLTRKPTWFVCPDREECEINAWEPATDLAEVRAVAGVTREIDNGASALDDEPAPQTAVPVVQSARGEMLGGYVGHLCPCRRFATSPIRLPTGCPPWQDDASCRYRWRCMAPSALAPDAASENPCGHNDCARQGAGPRPATHPSSVRVAASDVGLRNQLGYSDPTRSGR